MRALRKYLEFHQQEPRKVGQFHRDLKIPETATLVGDAVNVLYRSDKLNPTTLEDEGWIDYIHDHEGGVKVYRCDEPDGIRTRVPSKFRGATELTWLGDCLGFAFRDFDGKEVEAKGEAPLPELYTVPSGRCLLVIQGKRKILAMIWGGRLGVEARGIVY